MTEKPRLLFVSPVFLFPTDAGGKIRTTNVLRGMKGGAFHIILASPALPGQIERHHTEISSVCDEFVHWPGQQRGRLFQLLRPLALLSKDPASIVADFSSTGARCIAEQLGRCDMLVVDFIHAAILVPSAFPVPSAVFTHNVEAKIFERHVKFARTALSRMIWRDQLTKMRRFEGTQLKRFTAVIAVSDGDKSAFHDDYGIAECRTIPTGVDLDFFSYDRPPRPANEAKLVFVGSMDWRANIDAIEYFMDDIWPLIATQRPQCTMAVVGRTPPGWLMARARERKLPWSFSGFVDDVRPFVRDADVYVLPLRIGGGTRIKVYEAMAIGCPMVSTSIGVEGLPLTKEDHYLDSDDPADFAGKVVRLLDNPDDAHDLSVRARDFVSMNFGAQEAAKIFEQICRDALAQPVLATETMTVEAVYSST